MRPEPIETERLLLRPMSLDDAPGLFIVRSDSETLRFWDGPPHTAIAETRDMIENTQAGPGAWWTIFLRERDHPIGFIGFHGNSGVPGAGYILHRDHWRQGYGSEALRAVVTYGFNRLGLDRVELWIHEGNIASQRLAQKVGFTRKSQFRVKWPHFPKSHEMFVYGLLAREWPAAVHVPKCHPEFDRIEPILGVADVKATAEYYRDQLGFGIDFLYGDPPTHAAVSRGEWTFPAARIQFSQLDPGRAIDPSVSLFIFVGPDIERLRDTCRDLGVKIVSELEPKPWGMREFTIRDCNGYLLRFGTPG
jgi:ribosomal-protein-alanine N-acetyltransferase